MSVSLTVSGLTFLVGLGLLVIAIAGGGIEVKELRFPTLGTVPRLLSALLGSILMVICLFRPELLARISAPYGQTTEERVQTANATVPSLPTAPSVPSEDEPKPPEGRSLWAVGKSYVYLEATGDRRQFFFVRPSEELKNQGAKNGDQFFDGRKIGDAAYEGKLFVFAGRCGSRQYDASGPISNGLTTVTLVGKAPQIDPDNCEHTGDQDQTLIFDFKHR